jgi:hypothetical protein
VFEEIRETVPDRRHWLIPLALYVVCALACTELIISQPGPAAQLRQLTEQEFLPQLDHYVHEGTLTQGQADWLRLFITPGTAPFFFTQLAGTLLTAAAALFLLGAVLWRMGTSVLRRALPYGKALEVTGLTFVIAVLERIVTTILVVMTGSMFASPGPGLLLLGNTAGNAFIILSSLNLFTFWELSVAAAGLSRICQRDFPKVLVLLLALWLLWTLVTLSPLLFGAA